MYKVSTFRIPVSAEENNKCPKVIKLKKNLNTENFIFWKIISNSQKYTQHTKVKLREGCIFPQACGNSRIISITKEVLEAEIPKHG
jgi:hypothetical protein